MGDAAELGLFVLSRSCYRIRLEQPRSRLSCSGARMTGESEGVAGGVSATEQVGATRVSATKVCKATHAYQPQWQVRAAVNQSTSHSAQTVIRSNPESSSPTRTEETEPNRDMHMKCNQVDHSITPKHYVCTCHLPLTSHPHHRLSHASNFHCLWIVQSIYIHRVQYIQ